MQIMKTLNQLRDSLHQIDRKGYPAYKSLAGAWSFKLYDLMIDHVQGDPFASPSDLHIEMPLRQAGLPSEYYKSECGKTALEDYLLRQVAKQFEQFNFKAKGSGKSGLIAITRPGQEVYKRSACEINDKSVIVRFRVGFPAYGRTIQAGELEKILFDFLPRCIEQSLIYNNLDKKKVEKAVYLAEDQTALRGFMSDKGLVSFVENGAVLPRKSGVSNLPMKDSVPFVSPDTMLVTFNLPHRGEIKGMGISKGITLIVGGGYHGKSTLLEAVQNGVYNHIAGDGREFVLTDETALKLRAEDGRSIRNVDISLFIKDLPNGKDTTCFSTEDASGSTSQAAGVMEGIEAGSSLFLIDEDTSATNFMVRDELMQQVIHREKEPITPFLERAKELYSENGISTILVAGSSGAFFYIADKILQMDSYRPVDITDSVKELCKEYTAPRVSVAGYACPDFNRVLPAYKPKQKGGDRRGHGTGRGHQGDDRRPKRMKVKTFGLDSLSLDKETVDVRYVEQLVDSEQLTMLAYVMRKILEESLDGKRTVRQIVSYVQGKMEKDGFEPFCTGFVPSGLAMPRVQEVYACLNRYRG